MQLEAKATATATAKGEFTAIAAAYTGDRTNERIAPGAFAGTLRRWKATNKPIPVHWDHGRKAEDIIGRITDARETDAGVWVEGRLDIEDSAVAREAWRSVKRGQVSLSFGYAVLADGKGADGVRELRELDLFEVTLTATPANPDTRVLSAKAAELGIDPRPVKVATFEC